MDALINGPFSVYFIGGAVGLCILLLVYIFGSMIQTVLEGYRSGYSEAVQGTLEGMFLFITPQQLYALKTTTAALGFIIGALVAVKAPLFFTLLSGVIVASLLFFVPDKILRFMYQRRLEKFNDQLIDALVTLSNGLRSGLNFSQAMQVVVDEMPDPISQEFNLVIQQIKLGVQTEKALEDFAARIPEDEDLGILVTAINIARGIGGNLAEIFDNIASVIRERKRIEGKIKAITSQGRLQAIVMAAMPLVICLAMHFIDPDTLRYLYTTPPGIIIIVFVLLMDYIGYKVILMIVDIDI
jgi:tight adherence protein B